MEILGAIIGSIIVVAVISFGLYKIFLKNRKFMIMAMVLECILSIILIFNWSMIFPLQLLMILIIFTIMISFLCIFIFPVKSRVSQNLNKANFPLKILIIGNGGREHAIAHGLLQTRKNLQLIFAPGNGGLERISTKCIPVELTDVSKMVQIATSVNPDLVIVGPEIPLSLGLVDELNKKGINAFGPNQKAAQLESSKKFTKQLLLENNIPTAFAESFSATTKALDYVKIQRFPIVVKADGLAAGKGVTICLNFEEAYQAIKMALDENIFHQPQPTVLIEEYLTGEEASLLLFCSNDQVIPMVSAKDHKRIFDGDQGPNTGGMGAYSPSTAMSEAMVLKVIQEIIQPTIQALQKRDIVFKGVLYAGLMITEQGPKLIEYNCRFGDPETQVILPRLETDLLEVLYSVTNETLKNQVLTWNPKVSACVVLASKGYPGAYQIGKQIQGIEKLSTLEDIYTFHAGTQFRNGEFWTSGGRVLNIVGLADNLPSALKKTYDAVNQIHFDGMQYRKDIGQTGRI